MRRNPLYIFQDTTSIGIFDVPLKSTVHIVDAGNGYPMFVQLVAKQSINSTLEEFSTIANLLADPDLYIDIAASSGSTSQLEAIVENGLQGWRVLGRDPLFYSDIGAGAIDFSESDGINSESGGASGETSFATGFETIASGKRSLVSGYISEATGENSLATGQGTQAAGINTSTFGLGTKITNAEAMAIGRYNKYVEGAPEKTAFEIGNGVDSLNLSNAFEVYFDGRILAPSLDKSLITDSKSLITKEFIDSLNTISQLRLVNSGGNTGWRIEPYDDNLYGDIGNGAIDFSYRAVKNTTLDGATGDYSFAEGEDITASGNWSHAEGRQNKALGDASHAEGQGTEAVESYSHAEGLDTIASGKASHTEGKATVTTGANSHAEGNSTRAKGEASHVEGTQNTAEGESSHAEGLGTLAKGAYSHAEGKECDAVGFASHAEGIGTKAVGIGSHACGTYNVGIDVDKILEVGVGSSSAQNQRANALEVLISGQVRAPQCDMTEVEDNPRNLVTYEYLMNNKGDSELERINAGIPPGCAGSGSGSGDAAWRILGRNGNPEYVTLGCGAVDFSYSNQASGFNGASGQYSFAEGFNTRSIGMNSHAAGLETIAGFENQFVVGQYNADIDGAFTVGVGTSINRVNGLVVGKDGVVSAPSMDKAEVSSNDKNLVTYEYISALTGSGAVSQLEQFGNGWRLLGQVSPNIGDDAVDLSIGNTSSTMGALGVNSFALGISTKAGSAQSVAMGTGTEANGENAVAEGAGTIANGTNTHAAGKGTITDLENQFVVGQFNASAGDSLFVVGGGTAVGSEANLLEVSTTGAIRAPQGMVAAPGNNDLTTKDYVDNSLLTIDNLGDVDTATTLPLAGQALVWDGIAKWKPGTVSGGIEQGGVAFNPLKVYAVGDIVVKNDIAYSCNTITSAGEAPDSLFPAEAAKWTKIDTPERGGISYDTTTTYRVGDITTESGIAHVRNNNNLPVVPEIFVPGNWDKIDSPAGAEIGGVLWSNVTTYAFGDIVTDNVDKNVYTCTVAGSIGNQPNSLTDWKKVGSGASTFLGLTDTPGLPDYSGLAGQAVVVKMDDSGLEFSSTSLPTGLVYINQNFKNGWRLFNSVDNGAGANYDYIGQDAVDFSRLDPFTAAGGFGATGDNSVAFGIDNYVGGINSAVFGRNLRVNDDDQFVVGQYNIDITGAKFVVADGDDGTVTGPRNILEVGPATTPGLIFAPASENADIAASLDDKVLVTRKYLESVILSSVELQDDIDITSTAVDYEVGSGIMAEVTAVFLNGTKLRAGTDYTITQTTAPAPDKTEVTLTAAPIMGDWLNIVYKV